MCPVFPYIAVAAIANGYGGTISQHADVQAYLTLRLIRNALDGVDIDTGIGTADEAGNVLSDDVYYYDADSRSYYALNVAVTAGQLHRVHRLYQDLRAGPTLPRPTRRFPTSSMLLRILRRASGSTSTMRPITS